MKFCGCYNRSTRGLSGRDAVLAVENLAASGIAAEVMCFTNYPTENGREALMIINVLI
jgi:hypothetical protein